VVEYVERVTPTAEKDAPPHTRPDCPFCEIVAGRAPAQIATRAAGAVAFHPLDPVTDGHLLVVPIEHVEHFMHKPEVTGMVAEFAARIANHWMGGGDTNLITSAGGYATQTVRHLHFHIVPRSRDDGLLLPWHRAP
jgi:histidine triad (HIT) family protein